MKDKYTTERERYQIEALYRQGIKPKDIAIAIGKCTATIYNELKRGMTTLIDTNLIPYETYCADVAQNATTYNATNKGRDLKLGSDFEFVEYVTQKIRDEKYSPYAVLQEIDNNEIEFQTSICKNTLYNYIRNGLFLDLSMDSLPCPRKVAKKGKIQRKVALNNAVCKSIEDRDKSIYEREEYGHWEMDTVVSGHGGKNVLLVFTERKTRLEEVYKIASKSMKAVCFCLNAIERKIGYKRFCEKFKTITCDNGCEFMDNTGIETSVITKKQRTNLYYCHPYCSSERGSNENANRLIRRWIPKGADISKFTKDYIKKIQEWINNYPRKLFNGLSSNQILALSA